MALLLSCITASGLLVAPMAVSPRAAVRMALVDDFSISKVIKDVKVFDGDYAEEIRTEVIEVAQECIAEKGSFSLAVPGGSVVAALGALDKDAFDMSKMHIFFCNEKIPSFPCIEGALKETVKFGLPDENVHAVKGDTAAAAAEAYTKLLSSHPSIDNTGSIPSVDMMLLGTGPDGHCALEPSAFPNPWPHARARGAFFA